MELARLEAAGLTAVACNATGMAVDELLDQIDVAALLGGQVTAGVSGLGEFAQSISSGQLRALAISAPARVPWL